MSQDASLVNLTNIDDVLVNQDRIPTPNPGSSAALDMGCWCAVLDNNHGRWAPWPGVGDDPPGWWITAGCPLHAPGGDDTYE